MAQKNNSWTMIIIAIIIVVAIGGYYWWQQNNVVQEEVAPVTADTTAETAQPAETATTTATLTIEEPLDSSTSDVTEASAEQTVTGTYFSSAFGGNTIHFKSDDLESFMATNELSELLELFNLTEEFMDGCPDFHGTATVTFKNLQDTSGEDEFLGDMPTRFAEIVDTANVSPAICDYSIE